MGRGAGLNEPFQRDLSGEKKSWKTKNSQNVKGSLARRKRRLYHLCEEDLEGKIQKALHVDSAGNPRRGGEKEAAEGQFKGVRHPWWKRGKRKGRRGV